MLRARVALLIVGCTGDTDSVTSVPIDTGPTDTGTPIDPASWEGMQALFVEHCDRCHPSVAGFDLRDIILDDLEGQQRIVKPFEPQESVLWFVVSGQSYQTMPLDGLLPIETVQPIEDWILAGALLE